MNEIVMPKLSDTMTEGRLVSWKKRVGEAVRRGEVIAEVETDKANMELESFVSGELLEIRVQEGEMAQVGTVIAVIGNAEEKGAAPASQPQPPPEPPKPEAQPQAEPPPPAATAEQPAQEGDIGKMEGEKQAPAAPPRPGAEEAQPPGQPGESKEVPQPEQAPDKGAEEAPPAEAGRERAAPVVRRRARELGVELSQVHGTGPEGRILLEDLEALAQGGAPPSRPEAQPAQPVQPAQPAQQPSPAAQGVSAMPRLRAAVAKTVAESWDKIPHFTVTMDIMMDEAEAVRRQLKQSGMAVTINDLVVKAASLALQKYPQMNASYAAEGLQLHNDINISVAVGVPDGVLMPVINGCQHRSLLDISQEGKRLVDLARSGSLSEQEMHGGTFSVSNLGMFGVTSFSAIIHPAQAAVLAVGAVTETAMSHGGLLSSAKIMRVTLSADHRVVDGAYAAQFLVEFKEAVENPVRLLI